MTAGGAAPWELPGWSALAAGEPYARDGGFPIAAYSEHMPGPFVGIKPSGAADPSTRPAGDDHGWLVSAYQEAQQLAPGLTAIARGVAATIRRLQRGHRALSRDAIDGNPYTPLDLMLAGPLLSLRPLVGVLATSLARTQDDKGRVRWTLFGASEQGPAAALWCSFLAGPGQWVAAADGGARLRALVARLRPGRADADPAGAAADADPIAALHRAGVRVLPIGAVPEHPAWADEPLPPWLAPLIVDDKDAVRALRDTRVLITFRAFDRLPPPVRAAYLTGAIELVPSPHTLVFFGHRGYHHLAAQLPFATQIPLLRAVPGQHVALAGVRVPQSGWLDEDLADAGVGPPPPPARHGAIADRVQRTHRWNRTRRDQDERAALAWDDKVSDALFSTAPAKVGLYDKPMARNAQVWTERYQLLLDGPHATRFRIDEAARALAAGGRFGYRFHWPPMRVRTHDVYWQRPIGFAASGLLPRAAPGDGALAVELDAARGWLVAYDQARPVAALWPRDDPRPAHHDNLRAFGAPDRVEARHDVRKLLEVGELLAAPLDRGLAACLVGAKLTTHSTIDRWLADLPARAHDWAAGERLAAAIAATLVDPAPGPARTFARTATRAAEERYWDTIAHLATGAWLTKNNADPAAASTKVATSTVAAAVTTDVRDLDRLAGWLADRHAELIARHGLTGHAVVGEHRFRWATDFDFAWMRGWDRNQTEGPVERNVVVVIPGRDRGRALILADHYDTAYCEDVYDGRIGGPAGAGTRRAAAGADDNHSATAALLMAADVLLPMAKAGQLAHDVWLVHLTGEEFPGDCLGARHLVQRLIERNLTLELHHGGRHDLGGVDVVGAFVMDMIAHNLERDPYVFQIAPGEGAAAMRLAAAAQRANARWNQATAAWNAHPARRDAPPYQRRAEGSEVPAIARHPILHGEVRLPWHWSSTVFNTDAQIFADAGLPVVLLMEHYDIDRSGYHDTLDTLANIDLDFGAALMAIAIETVAELATTGAG